MLDCSCLIIFNTIDLFVFSWCPIMLWWLQKKRKNYCWDSILCHKLLTLQVKLIKVTLWFCLINVYGRKHIFADTCHHKPVFCVWEEIKNIKAIIWLFGVQHMQIKLPLIHGFNMINKNVVLRNNKKNASLPYFHKSWGKIKTNK